MQNVSGILSPDNVSLKLNSTYKLESNGWKEIKMTYGTVAEITTKWPGWQLCDGTNGTPDLRDQFIVCASADSGGVAKTTLTGSPTKSGGSTTITQANLPNVNLGSVMRNGGSSYSRAGGGGNNTDDVNLPLGGSGTPYTQPYYALCFIAKP